MQRAPEPKLRTALISSIHHFFECDLARQLPILAGEAHSDEAAGWTCQDAAFQVRRSVGSAQLPQHFQESLVLLIDATAETAHALVLRTVIPGYRFKGIVDADLGYNASRK